jgi:pimeloyl-ACP methyl ester carboxylesterase
MPESNEQQFDEPNAKETTQDEKTEKYEVFPELQEKIERELAEDAAKKAKEAKEALLEKEKREDLGAQYDRAEKVKLNSGDIIEMIDIESENLKTEVPLTYLKGWATDNKACKGRIVELAMSDRRVLAINDQHGIDSRNITPEEKERAAAQMENLYDIELRKAALFLEMLEKKSLEKTDVVAHSEGALYAVIAALMHPEKVRNLVLVDPAGMIGKDTKMALIKRTLMEDTRLQGENIKKMEAGIDPRLKYHPESAKTPAQIKKMGVEARESASKAKLSLIESLLTGPIQDAKSIDAIAGTQIAAALQFLREEYGIKVGIIHAVDDKIFPIEDVQRNLSSKMVDGSYAITGTHVSFGHNPEKYVPLIVDLLDGLQRKREKES